jgi:prevent-host-death family protein
MIAKKNRWQLQEAKARLSEVVRLACTDGPQTITLRGEDAVVVVSAAEYAASKGTGRSLYEILRNSPVREEDIDTIFARQPETEADRPVPVFDEG